MKKNITVVIIAAVVVAALVGVMIFVLNIPDTEDSGISSDTLDILLYDKTSIKPEEITVKNSGGEYTLLGFDYTKELEELSKEMQDASEEESSQTSLNRMREEVSSVSINMSYTMQGMEKLLLSKDATDALAYQCSYVTALQLIDKSGERYKDFGLDKPRSVVKVTFSDNSQETLYVGKDAPNDMGVYFRTERNPNVYLVNSESISSFLVEKLQMFDKTITKKFDYKTDEDVEIESISISGTGYEKPLEIDKEPAISLVSKYKMRSPYIAPCAQEAAQSFGRTIYGLTGSFVAAADITDADKKKFGLDKPYMNIKVRASDDTSVGILVSEAEKDGSCYVMADSGKIIFKMTKSDVGGWYGVTEKKFRTIAFVYPNTDRMDKAVITAGGKTTVYDIMHDRQENDLMQAFTITTVTSDGNSVEYVDFNTLIKNIGGLGRTGVDITSDKGFEEVFKAELSYSGDDGEKIDDVLSIKKGSDGSYIVVINGRVEGYTDREYAETLIGQAHDVLEKGKIVSLIDDEEDENAESSEQSENSKAESAVSEVSEKSNTSEKSAA